MNIATQTASSTVSHVAAQRSIQHDTEHPRTRTPGALDPDQVAGPFSIVGKGGLAVDAVPGLVVRVRRGELGVTRENDSMGYIVRAGEDFLSDRVGELELWPLSRTEVELDWPHHDRRAAQAESPAN